jgi:transcriptional regulatory protein LEU3
MVGARRFEREPSLRATLTPDYVRLLWSSISEAPQPYHTVKALCLVCFWPIPTDGLAKDPTSQLSGLMMQIALQNMLHLDHKVLVPFRGELAPAEQRDRLMTWATCNIVAER